MSGDPSKTTDIDHKLATQMAAMTLGQKGLLPAMQLLNKAIKCEKTSILLTMRARLHMKLKSPHLAYVDLSEALRLKHKDITAIRLQQKISHVLHPLKRRIELAEGMIASAYKYMNVATVEEAIHLLNRAMALGVTKLEFEILTKQTLCHSAIGRFESTYIHAGEVLMRDHTANETMVKMLCESVVRLPGYKRGASAFNRNGEMRRSRNVQFAAPREGMQEPLIPYKRSNWPIGLKLWDMDIQMHDAAASLMNGRELMPRVRFADLPRFLNTHVVSISVLSIKHFCMDELHFATLCQIRPNLLVADALTVGAMDFRLLPRGAFDLLFGGGMLAAPLVGINHSVLLPRSMHIDDLFRMGTFRGACILEFDVPIAPIPQKISTVAALEHISLGGRCLRMHSGWMQDEPASFIDALIKDFMADEQKKVYSVLLWCPSLMIQKKEARRFANPHTGDQLHIEERIMPANAFRPSDYLMIQARRCESGGTIDFKWN